MIAIIDFGISNIGSVYNALSYLNIKCKIISKANELKVFKKIYYSRKWKVWRGYALA